MRGSIIREHDDDLKTRLGLNKGDILRLTLVLGVEGLIKKKEKLFLFLVIFLFNHDKKIFNITQYVWTQLLVDKSYP